MPGAVSLVWAATGRRVLDSPHASTCDHRKIWRRLYNMVMRDVVSDLTALVHPLPVRPGLPDGEDDEEGWSLVADQVLRDREELSEQLYLNWEHGDADPLLGLVAEARREMLDAERRMRLLIAYGREFVGPRPYTLDGLAQAAGMSISGVRTAYDDDEVTEVATRTGARPRRRDNPTGTDANATDADATGSGR